MVVVVVVTVVVVGSKIGNLGCQNIVNIVFMRVQNNIGDGIMWFQNNNKVPSNVS